MTRVRVLVGVIPVCLILAFPSAARAACVNKYVAQKSGNRLSFTLLTGMLDFDDAKKLSEAIASGAHAPLAWVDGEGKVIAKQFGELKVVRPMPVACEEKTSGVVVLATFISIRTPSKIVRIVLDPDKTVDFEAQNN
ncbi:MAG TPA: hypothetical protein VLV48_00645 [Thermoanaerobaculia bacterium]|nr:hypothetical protein [Thermoanaerobaculia bacterium]